MLSAQWKRSESHFFRLGDQAFLYAVQSSSLFRLNYPCDLIWLACLGQTKAEIVEILMSKGCSLDELRDAWTELESHGLIYAGHSSMSAQTAPTLTGVTSLYVQIRDPDTGATLAQETASRMLTFLTTQSLPDQQLFLVLDLRSLSSLQLREYEVVKYIVEYLQDTPRQISCAIKLDACQLTQSLISFTVSNHLNLLLLMDRFFQAKRCEPTTYANAVDHIFELHQHQRSVACLSLSGISPTYELEMQLNEIRQLGFKAFYIYATPGFFYSFAPNCEGNTDLAWAQPYVKAIQKEVRPYFVFANAIFQQQPTKRWYKCQAGITHLAVSTQGGLYPCIEFIGGKFPSLGHLKDMKGGLPVQATFARQYVDNNETCQKCWARYRCGGDCAYFTSQNCGRQAHPQSVICDFTRSNLEQQLAKCTTRSAAGDLLIKLWYRTLLPYMPHLGDPTCDEQRLDQIIFCAKGGSMLPTIREGDQVEVTYLHPNDVQAGDIILFERDNTIIAHRVLHKLNYEQKVLFVEKGDALSQPLVTDSEKVFAKVVNIKRRDSL